MGCMRMVWHYTYFDILNVLQTKSHHKEVIKEEDLSLVDPCPLRSVRVRDFVELAATYQSAMWKGQHLFF